MRKTLSRKLINYHSRLMRCSPQKQVSMELKMVLAHIFSYLSHNPSLIARDISSNAPRKVIKDEYVPALNISETTLETTASVWLYTQKRRSKFHFGLEPLGVMNDMMHGRTSLQSMDYVNFYNVAQIAYDLSIPLEYLIYGTTNHSQIAQYNYCYYDAMTRIGRGYLRAQMSFNGTVRSMLIQLKKNGYTVADISRQLQTSRQSLYNFINSNAAIFRHRRRYTQLCYLSHTDPIQQMTYRKITPFQLKELSDKYCQSRRLWVNKRC